MTSYAHTHLPLRSELHRVRALPMPASAHRTSSASSHAPSVATVGSFSAARPLSVAPTHTRRGAPQGRSPVETLQYRFIFAIAFLVFLVTSTLERVLPSGKAKAIAKIATDRPSLFSRAKESAHICAAYAFMG